MNDQQAMFVKYATLLQRLSSPKYPLSLQIDCDIPEDEEARMMRKDGAPPRTVGKFISARCGWDGRIACWINLADLNMSRAQVGPLTGLLLPSDPHLNALGEALVESHKDNFLDFIGTFESAGWQQACLGKGACQFQLRTVPELGPHLLLTLTARFVTETLGAADERKVAAFPRHVQFGRYASLLLHLARGRYPVRLVATTFKHHSPPPPPADWAGDGMDEGVRWHGDLSATVNQPDLGVSVGFIRSCRPLLDEKRELTDWLGEALLAARLDDFEAYIAGLPPDDWQFAARAHRHRYWGLHLYEDPYQFAFLCHVSRIYQVLNDRLLQAAAEGNR